MIPALLHFFGIHEGDIQGVSSVSLEFRNAEALGWLVFVALLLGGFVWWCYFRQAGHQELTMGRKRTLTTLRVALLMMIVLLLLRPVLALDLQEHIRRTVLLLVDSTKSMNIRDQRVDETDQKRAEIGMGAIHDLSQPLDPAKATEAGRLSRAELVKAVLQNPQLHLIDTLKKDFDVETFLVGQTVMPADGPGWLMDYHPASNTTALGDSVRDVLARKRGQPMAGIVLITDGGNNSGSPPTEAAEAANREGVPIFAYGVGITSPRDIIVSHLAAPEIAFAKDEVSVTVQVKGQGLSGQTAKVSLKLGNGEVASKDVTFTGADQIVSMNFTPQEKGEYELTASIAPRDDEISKENNVAQQRMRIIDEKIKILYIEGTPRWEFRFLQQVLLRDKRLAASFVLMDADASVAQGEGTPYLPAIPADKATLYKYDMIIVGDVDPKSFTAEQVASLGEFVSKFGGACMFIAGHQYMPGAYRGTLVEKMLPVELESFRETEGPAVRALHLVLTPAGQTAQMLRLAPDEEANAQLWANLPPIYWDFKVARPKPAAQVLIEDAETSRANVPVLVTQQYGVGQVFYLGTDDLWRWRRDEGVNEYPLFWGQVVQGAAMPHLLGASKKTQLSVDKQEHNAGDPVTVFARLYNDSFQPIADSQVQATYTIKTEGGTGEKTDLILRAVPEQPGMYRGDFVALKPGRYQVSATRDPATVVEFDAREPQFELGETAMNEPLLKQMASISGGKYFREENLADLGKELNARPETLHTARDLEIWSSPFFLTLMCCVASLEWILRKKWNLK